MTSRAHLIIYGKVQGVFYRASARDKALRIGISGWVKNIPEGRVEAVFEGEKNRVNRMIEWCKKGPSYSQVDEVAIEWEEPEGEKHFEVRYK